MSTEAGTRSHNSSERLAYWYFLLNGFMTIEDFLVHPEFGSDPRTDVDILATRFRYRRENAAQPMIDDPLIAKCETFANIIIAEIKTGGWCRLNGPWTNQDDGNMERVLRSVGCCATEREVDLAARSLYRAGKWSNDIATVRLFAVAEWKDPALEIGVEQQIEWSSVIDFIVDRFQNYEEQKAEHSRWPEDGHELRERALRNDIDSIRRYFGLNPPRAAAP